jgi:hypothetical protein
MTLDEYCRRELELFKRRLGDLKGGRLKVGTSTDGYSWTDTTADEIIRAGARIEELTRLVGGSTKI